ncbi:MAG: type II toxin-antitoxin system Phd/YefM family antitoxin [Marinobacterium sp.]
MTHPIYAEMTASVSELKKNPMATVKAGEGFPVAVLNRNKPAFYCVPADLYEAMLEQLDDQALIKLVEARHHEPSIPVNLDDL